VIAALVCGALVAVTAPSASATAPAPHTATFSATVAKPPPDGSCEANPDFPKDPGYRLDVSGRFGSRFGPARITLRLCYMFTGAIASRRLYGSFSIATFAGTLRGRAEGWSEQGQTESTGLTLSVERGTWWLANVRGDLHYLGTFRLDRPGLDATLTSDLHRSWGRWHQPTPFPLT
jgi:hypothetical protein